MDETEPAFKKRKLLKDSDSEKSFSPEPGKGFKGFEKSEAYPEPGTSKTSKQGLETKDSKIYEDKYSNLVSQEEVEKLREFQVLDEVKSNDEDSNDDDSDDSGDGDDGTDGTAVNMKPLSDLPDEEIERMLDEDLPEELKAAPKPKEKTFITRSKIILEEKGINHFEVLPLDWMMVRHHSGMPVYMHRTTRVCTLSKPYFLGKGNTRRHDIPISAIPCLAYRKALEEEAKQKEIDKEIQVQIKSGSWKYANDVNKTKPSSENAIKCPFRQSVSTDSIANDNSSVQETNKYNDNESNDIATDDIRRAEQYIIANAIKNQSNEQQIETIKMDSSSHEGSVSMLLNNPIGQEESQNSNQNSQNSQEDWNMDLDSNSQGSQEILDEESKEVKDNKCNKDSVIKILSNEVVNSGYLVNNELNYATKEDTNSIIKSKDEVKNDSWSLDVNRDKGTIDKVNEEVTNDGRDFNNKVNKEISGPSKLVFKCVIDKSTELKIDNYGINNEVNYENQEAIKVDNVKNHHNRTLDKVDKEVKNDNWALKEVNHDTEDVSLNNAVDYNNVDQNIEGLNNALDHQINQMNLNIDNAINEDNLGQNNGDVNEVHNGKVELDGTLPPNRQPVVLPGGIVMPPPRVETVSTSWKTQHLTSEQVNDYCKRLFQFKVVNIMHFKRWADRRKYTKARKTLQYPTLPEGTKLITIPAQPNAGQDPAGGKATKRDWVMNMNGRSYLSVFHEYVRRALQKQPVYDFKQLENAATPYQATVFIGGMQYGVGHGSSKRAAKSAAARASIHILIPEMRNELDGEDGPKQEPDFSFFDYVGIEDPRITEFCAAACEPSPHAILRTCLLRNFGATDRHITTEMKKLEYQKIELTMKVGRHTATVVCKNKKTAKQRASQAILQALHPHVRSWGSLLRLYGSRSVKSCKEKKLEEQQITLLQDSARRNEPNHAVLEKLRNEMRKLRARDEAVVPIGKLLLTEQLPSHSGSNLNNVDF